MSTAAGDVYRVVSDHLGSVRILVNATTGAVVERYDYDAWGRVTFESGDHSLHPFGYAGGLYDADTGLVRFGVRDYDADTGRWTAPEPLGFAAETNWYRYASGDPVNFVDPSGELPVLALGAVAFIGGYVIGTLIWEAYDGDFEAGGPVPNENYGWGPFTPVPGDWAPDWHRNRNRHQSCPPTASQCGGSQWTRDDSGAHDAQTYRGNAPSNRGYQCSYDAAGNLSNDPVRRGSYDYGPPSTNMMRHLTDDVIPAFVWGASP
ncbi:MAG: RHS repeat-associated core domain-containing protein [Polyangiales bacterium]